MRVALTGYSGFVGSEIRKVLKPFPVTLLGRRCPPNIRAKEQFQRFDLLDSTHTQRLELRNVECLIHCAAIAHQSAAYERESESRYMQANYEAALTLAQQAAKQGVQRFVFISSVKVFGEHMRGAMPFDERSAAEPEGPYAVSKLKAEQALLDLAAKEAMEVVIIRLPLVYGAGVKGNFAKLGWLAGKGWPLPLGRAQRLRSMVGLRNATDFIIAAARHPDAAGERLLVTDASDYSTASLLTKLAEAQGKRVKLVNVPEHAIAMVCRLGRRHGMYARLFEPYQVDAQHSRERIGWQPIYSFEDELSIMYKHES